jgi:hypothetical protein
MLVTFVVHSALPQSCATYGELLDDDRSALEWLRFEGEHGFVALGVRTSQQGGFLE